MIYKGSKLVASSAVNDTGTLAELVYATGQGKKALAAALVNKGVAAAAEETLLALADKVNNLIVDNNAERIVCPMAEELVSSTASAAMYGLTRNRVLGYTAYVINAKLYVLFDTTLPQVSDYESLTTRADVSVALKSDITATTICQLSTSINGQYITVRTQQKGTDIYKLDPTAKTLTLQTTGAATAWTFDPRYAVVGVSNDGQLLAMQSNKTGTSASTSIFVWSIKNATEYSVAVGTASSQAAFVYVGDGRIVTCPNSSVNGLKYVDYTVDEAGVVTFGAGGAYTSSLNLGTACAVIPRPEAGVFLLLELQKLDGYKSATVSFESAFYQTHVTRAFVHVLDCTTFLLDKNVAYVDAYQMPKDISTTNTVTWAYNYAAYTDLQVQRSEQQLVLSHALGSKSVTHTLGLFATSPSEGMFLVLPPKNMTTRDNKFVTNTMCSMTYEKDGTVNYVQFGHSGGDSTTYPGFVMQSYFAILKLRKAQVAATTRIINGDIKYYVPAADLTMVAGGILDLNTTVEPEA